MAGLFSSMLYSPKSRNPSDDFWFTDIGPMSSSGVFVSHDRAMQVAAVLACIKVISETEAALPFPTYRRLPNGDKEGLKDHPVRRLLHDQANSEHTALELREIMTAWCLLRGTSIAEIMQDRRGVIGELLPIHPEHWRPVAGEQRGQWFIEVNEPGRAPTLRPREEYFLLRAMATRKNSIEGLDPIMAERHAVGSALAVQDYAARFFKNDTRGGGILKHPGTFKNEEDRDRFRKQWNKQSQGDNAHGTRILEFGMEYQALGITNEQAQFLETRKYLDTDIARIFRVQPHKIGILDRATFSNIEQQSIEFVVDTMLPWLVRWEQAVKRDLIVSTQERDVFLEHNVSGLLRGDLASRYKAYATGRNWGWLSANDVRRLENMNSIGADGDEYLRPANMQPTDAPESDIQDASGKPVNGAKRNGFNHEGKLWHMTN